MKRAISIFLLHFALCAVRCSAWVITNDNTSINLFASSYDTYPYHYFGDYIGSAVALGLPQYTNDWNSCSRSGGSIQDANETRMERIGVGHWAYHSRAIGLIMADDNGGFTSNQVCINLTNTLSAPTNLFNGTAYTNEGGWCATNKITWIGIGAIPHDSIDGDGGEVARNGAVTNMFTTLGLMSVDMWRPLWNPNPGEGWGIDETNGVVSDWNPGSHPNAALSLTMGINIARVLAGPDTNVSLAIVDWSGAAVVSTNHCVVSGISLAGNTLTFTRHDDRLPMAWDVPNAGNGTTNNCTDAFRIIPSMANAFWFTLGITNAPAGTYSVAINGTNIATLTQADFIANGGRGYNMFTNMNGPDGAQRANVLLWIRNKNGCDPVTLIDHSAGNGGVNNWLDLVNWNSQRQANWDAGDRGDTLIADAFQGSTNLYNFNKAIHDAAQPVARTYTVTLISSLAYFPMKLQTH